jgi:hypothetical protein
MNRFFRVRGPDIPLDKERERKKENLLIKNEGYYLNVRTIHVLANFGCKVIKYEK